MTVQNGAMQQQTLGTHPGAVMPDHSQPQPRAEAVNGHAHAKAPAASVQSNHLVQGPVVGLAIALAFTLLVTGQILMFLHYYGDSLAPTRLPYVENFSGVTRLDYRQFGGRWAVNDAKLVQSDTQDSDLLAVLPNLNMPAGEPYTISTEIQVLAGPKGGGLVFNMQNPTSRRESHMVRFGSDDTGDYLVWGYFDETATYVAQGSTISPAFSDVVELAVEVRPETYAVLVNGQPVVVDAALEYAGGHLALTTWFSSIAFDDVAVSSGTVPATRPAPSDGAQVAAVVAPVPDDQVDNAMPDANLVSANPISDRDFLDSPPVDSYFTAAFGDLAEPDAWRSVDGDWRFQDGALVQLSSTGFDRAIVRAGRFSDFTLRAQFEHQEGTGGGALFNVNDATDNKHGHLVRYMAPDVVAWGYFDEQRVFHGQGSAVVAPAGTAPHTLEVTVIGDGYAITLDGVPLATAVPLVHHNGAVGLTASESIVAFTGLAVEPAAQ